MRYPRVLSWLLPAMVAATTLAVLLWPGGDGQHEARANPELTVGIDLNPNTPSTYESCIPISGPGVQFDVDVFVLDVDNLMAFSADIEYESDFVNIVGVDVEHFLGNDGVDASSWGTDSLFAAGFDQTSAGHSGSGVLARISLQSVANGESPFDLDLNPAYLRGVTLKDPDNVPLGDTDADTLFDGPFINEETTISVGGVGDSDGDGVPDGCDNCPGLSNPSQTDTDGDGIGDACDPDDDGDGIPDFISPGPDNCRLIPNPGQEDWNSDGQGDVCDDSDSDTVMDDIDNCRTNPNTDQADMDGDGVGDVCDPDKDGDGYDNGPDNCPDVYNPDQTDTDGNGAGDACQDSDGDGLYDTVDNCPNDYNQGQEDNDSDGVGDLCDNCQSDYNPGQENTDGDALGDVCDWDDDNDGICDPGETSPYCTGSDNCQLIANGPSQSGIECVGNQTDTNGDGIGDPCDPNADSDPYPKALEEGYGSKDCDASSTPEVCDDAVTDEDGDGQFNEGFDYSRPNSGIPSNGAPNGIPDCTEDVHSDDDGTANPNDDDDDNDGTSDVDEGIILTDSLCGCDNGVGYPDWPPDFDDDQLINLSDLNKLLPPPLGSWGATTGNQAYSVRRDLVPDGVINIADLNRTLPAPLGFWGQMCTP